MKELQQRATEIVLADPAVAGVGSSVGGIGFNASVNHGRLFISLKPLVRARQRQLAAGHRPAAPQARSTSAACGCSCSRRRTCASAAGRASSHYQFTLWDPDLDELLKLGAARRRQACRALPGLVDVTTDREQGGLQVNVVIDRAAAVAARRAHPGHRQRAQQRVLAAADLDDLHPAQPVSRDPRGRSAVPARSRPISTQVYVAGQRQHAGAAVQRGAVSRTTLAPLVVNHQGQFPAVTITLQSGARTCRSRRARARSQQAVAELHLPDTLHAEFAGDAQGVRSARSARSRC